MSEEQPEARGTSLADKLNRLFATVHPPGRGPYSNREVEAAIRAAGGSISEQYLWLLRNGRKDNPTIKHIEALARFFDVPVAYFFDDSVAERYDAELRLLAALRDAQVRRIALRAMSVTPEALSSVAEILEQLPKRRAAGSPPSTEPWSATDA
jgi:transcriptional regulator with XRE-family HTH domain